MRLRFDEILQNLELAGLRVAIVHHFIQELVDHHEVISDRLLLELLEVLDKDIDQLVQKLENHQGIAVSLGDSQKNQVVVVDVEKDVVIFILQDGLDGIFVVLEKLLVENVMNIWREVCSVRARDQDSALVVQNIDG